MASPEEINGTWFATFVLAVLVLGAVCLVVPGARGLAKGKDGRVSTSKLQVLLWTYAVLFALFSFFFAFLTVELLQALGYPLGDRLEEPLGGRFDDFIEDGLDETYLLLLGFPLAAAVSAKAITSTKVEDGSVVKLDKSHPDAVTSGGVQEVVADDEGKTDLGDFQYFLFNLLAVGYFGAQFLAHPARGLPDLPDTLVGLTGVAAAAYVAKKGVYREPPVLLSVIPPYAAPGETVKLYGSRLLGQAPVASNGGTAPARTTTVLIGRMPATTVGDPSESGATVEVPRRANAGATTVQVVRPPGAKSEELPFEVLERAPTITAVRPDRLRPGIDARVAVDGADFLLGRRQPTAKNGVTIGGRPMPTSDDQWTDTRIVLDLPTSGSALERLGLDAGQAELIVYDAEGRPSQPRTVRVEEGDATNQEPTTGDGH